MNTKTAFSSIAVGIITLAALMILLLAMRSFNEILSPVLMSLILAICASPLLKWFQTKGLPGWLALVITLGVILILLLTLVWLVGGSVQEFFRLIPDYEQRFAEIEQDLGGVLDKLGVNPDDLDVSPELTKPINIIELIARFVGKLIAGLSNWGLILMTILFFLVEALNISRKVENISKEEDHNIIWYIRLAKRLRDYMVINAGVGALAAVINAILLWLMGIPFAVLWGIISFFFSFVPNVGFWISVIPPALLALVQYGFGYMMIVIVAYIVINFLVDTVLKPRIIAEGVNINATVTFLSLIIWGWVLGPAGAILSVPMSIIVQAILDSREETRWLAYMMGTGVEPFKLDEGIE